ncbi:MAG TPA: vanadium-dependent haloperoxidase [Pilimelia sp.]|nr:vanadium-dependent haloperoxidase [Pilimelia sp.]
MALKWSEQTLASIRAASPAPTVVSRILAIVQTSVYDAWAAYDPAAVGTRLGGSLRRPPAERTLANKSKAISFAAYRALYDLFPPQRTQLTAFMSDLGYDPADTSTDPATPAGVGNRAAAAVLQFRHGDGSNQLGDINGGAPYSDYTGYVPVNTPDQVNDQWHWQPLRVGTNVQRFATPQWGRVVPFALTAPGQFPVPGPDIRKDYKKPLKEVVKFSAKLTDTDKMISEYWEDGPGSELPPGHGAIFANALCRKAGNNIDNDVKVLFLQANAVLDAGIAVWHYKVKHDFVRPITLVRVLMKDEKIKAWGGPGQGTVEMLGQNWMPYQRPTVVTPPFAEYVSGHSTFTAATFEVLRTFTGSSSLNLSVTIRPGSSRIEPGITPSSSVRLTWRTHQDAANQAGISREFGGIHFSEGDDHGRALGAKIGAAVVAKAQRYFNGTA